MHLGYETGTGKAVEIPLAHMAITGQTQQSGKTTTLEALIERGDIRAVVFVTKPGEKSFSEGRRILPYFKERADWEYVKELLESRLNESLGSKVGYLMRACSRARTLADVRKNIVQELPKKKSARPSMYEVLAGYIDLIIAEMERVEYTDKLELVRGVNIMDLTGMSEEMQSLVIRSTIERIHKSEKRTVLVMPEAWKFIPEGGRSPVFHALHSLIREGATNENFVWIDAQDLAIVSKRILKSVSVWILGKQQEANEVARTINHLIEPLHIRPDMIKSLGIGQFLVCDGAAARKVYVQPRWLGELDAMAIARGEESVETAQMIFRQKKRALATAGKAAVISESRSHGEKQDAKNDTATVGRIPKDQGKTDRAGHAVESAGVRDGEKSPRTVQTETADARTGGIAVTDSEDESMWKEKYEAAMREIAELKGLLRDYKALRGDLNRLDDGPELPTNGDAVKIVHEQPFSVIQGDSLNDLDRVYEFVKRRVQNDPQILQILATRPELRVRVEPKILEVDETNIRGAIGLLIHEGFFKEARSGNNVVDELIKKRHLKFGFGTVYDGLKDVSRLGFLVADKKKYTATGLKVTVTK